VESMPNGGNISIYVTDAYFDAELGNESEKRIKEGRYLRIKIIDEGFGISKHDMQYIFEPFFSTKNNPLNPGIGLTVAKKIIEQHNGFIKIINTSEKGTEVNLYLPSPDARSMKNMATPNEQSLHGSTSNILLIDDEEIVRTITTELLKKLGHNIFSFSSCTNAIKFYADNHANIDLVFLDMQMPDMDGKQVFEQLRTIKPTGKVIMLSGFIHDSRIDELLGQGLSKFVQKPVSIEKLASCIAETLTEK
jgi:two-component system, cell cycle sensor histidine kinase and response regulator CckA